MTFADLYARTVLRRDWHVCGELLLPLRVGHCRILEALNLWQPMTWVDLMTVVWICARPASLFRMPRGLREKIAWRVRLWRLGTERFPMHAMAWHRYIHHHMAVPVVAWSGKGGRAGTPPMASLRAGLISIGYSPETVDEVPIDQALADYYARLEAEGRMTVAGRTDEELDEQIRNARLYVQSLGKN